MTTTLQRNLASRILRPGLRALPLGVLMALSLAQGIGHADEAPPPPRPAAAAAPSAAAPAAAAPAAAPAAAAPVAAATAPSAAAAPDKDGFVPESRPPAMNNVEAGLPAAPLVGAAYGFIWLAVFGFVVWTLRRTTQLEADIADLRARISAQGGSK